MPSRAERERTQQRRALRQLADAPEGMTEALMMVHGFNSGLLVDLCIAGLAIAKVERMTAGGHTVEVVRLKITGRHVCTKNLIRFDCVTESHNVRDDGCANMLLSDAVGLAVQVEEPA
jgi:hypothetical protein